MRIDHRAGTGLAVAAAITVASAVPAVAASDPWQSQQGIYHYFSVPRSEVPSQTCGDGVGAGVEIEGNFGPAKTWAAGALGGDEICGTNIGPLEPGMYHYQYVARMADRSKVVFRNSDAPIEVTSHPNWNTLFVPGPEVAWMDDVASGGGSVAELTYDSPVAGSAGSAMVWTPPGYSADQAKAYPVLYLLADEGQSAKEWLELGRAQQVLDNLAVDGELASMVVVMADAGDADFRTELMDAIVPAVRSAYNVSHSGKKTGIAGIGRGAAQALDVAVSEPGAFGSVGSFSGYLSDNTSVSPAQARKLNAKTDLLRFYVGSTLDPNYNSTFEARQALQRVGVRAEFDGVNPKTGGVWDTWRENLRDFASRAFQPHVADRGPSPEHLAQNEAYTAPAVGSITTPHIDDNGMVTFETGTQWADAKDVVLWGNWAPNGQWFRIPLEKVGDRWRTTIGPIDGYYYWRYEVDGDGKKDPHDTTNVVNMESQLFVPGGERTPLLADAPADQTGEVATLSYTGEFGDSKAKVWTPVDYDPNRAEAYPVLYLYHGYGQNYAAWTEVGRAAQILDNLYAQGEIEPMVVVMPGYTAAPGDIWPDLSGKVMPLVESQFNISDDPEQRALAGLSWGGFLTNGTMLNHPGNFAHYGLFSPPFLGATFDPSTPEGQKVIATTKSVTLYAGDVDGGAVAAVNGFEASLTAGGIPVTKTIVPGPHGFDVWWQGLSAFLPTLF